jgi:hypothetical protein
MPKQKQSYHIITHQKRIEDMNSAEVMAAARNKDLRTIRGLTQILTNDFNCSHTEIQQRLKKRRVNVNRSTVTRWANYGEEA